MDTHGSPNAKGRYYINNVDIGFLFGVEEFQSEFPYSPGQAVKYLSGDGIWRIYVCKIANTDAGFPSPINWDKISKTVLEITESLSSDPNTPVIYDPATGVISFEQSSSTTDGFLSKEDFEYFVDKEDAANKDTAEGYVGRTAYKINFINDAGDVVSYLSNQNTSSRTYEFPDRNFLIGSISDWSPNTIYKQNEVVLIGSFLYKCKTPHTSAATFSKTNWDQITFLIEQTVSIPTETVLAISDFEGNVCVWIGNASSTWVEKVEIDILSDSVKVKLPNNSVLNLSTEEDKASSINIFYDNVSERLVIQNKTLVTMNFKIINLSIRDN